MKRLLTAAAILLATGLAWPRAAEAAPRGDPLRAIETIVVIYAENRSFDHLYGQFPGADGLQPGAVIVPQRDRDGGVLPELPPVWGGLTAPGVTPAIGEEKTGHLPNRPFAIDAADGFDLPMTVATRDLWHRFYQNQMQIDGGRNDKFAAYSDAGGLVMGHYRSDAASLPLWRLARAYTLADHFFMGAFGGSFLNHFYLICACVPHYPGADHSPARDLITAVESDGITLRAADASPRSALQGPPVFVRDGALTPDFFAVNTMQPPYQPSANRAAAEGDPAYADPARPTTLPPQTAPTIGDLLSAQGIDWAWYAGAWQAALDGASYPIFQTHHQPFNYFAAYAPGTAARRQHLLDAGREGEVLLAAIDRGALPAVTFYKPPGALNEHPGYATVASGDRHIAEVVRHLRRSPQWKHMLVLVTYDENGGFWDHLPPPAGDRWGPGTRIPTLIISPYARHGFVDHTPYDTSSILRLITRRFALPRLPGLAERDSAARQNGLPPPGDLTAALRLTPRGG